MGISRAIHDIGRARTIVSVLARYGFGSAIERLNVRHNFIGRKLLSLHVLRAAEMHDVPAPVKLRRALEELGPTFIKLGQVLSMRPDLIPPEYASELTRLQDEVPGLPYSTIRAEIERELNRPISEIFDYVQREPKACASLAQVHEARLVTGETVIIKVQRPGLREIVTKDIEILEELADLAEKHLEESRLFSPRRLVREFRDTIYREMDFSAEAGTIVRFREQFKNDPSVVIPFVYREYLTPKILVMERIDGIKITDLASLAKAGLDRKRIAQNCTDALLTQIFINGLFHADPHPGNILVLDNNRIAFLDFGMAGRMTAALRSQLADLLVHIVRHEIPEIRESFVTIGEPQEQLDQARLDLDLEDFIDRYYNHPLHELNLGQLLMHLIHIVSRYRIRLPSDLFLLSKVLVTVEGVVRVLDPDFNMIAQVKPFVERMQKERYSSANLARETRRFLHGLSGLVRAFPRDAVAVLDKLKRGTLKVEFEHRGLEPLAGQIGRSSNRVALSLIIAALIVGSSIVIHANRGPLYGGLPVIGLIGFVAAAIMGLWLVIVIISSRSL